MVERQEVITALERLRWLYATAPDERTVEAWCTAEESLLARRYGTDATAIRIEIEALLRQDSALADLLGTTGLRHHPSVSLALMRCACAGRAVGRL